MVSVMRGGESDKSIDQKSGVVDKDTTLFYRLCCAKHAPYISERRQNAAEIGARRRAGDRNHVGGQNALHGAVCGDE